MSETIVKQAVTNGFVPLESIGRRSNHERLERLNADDWKNKLA